jgi:hypothetical protein
MSSDNVLERDLIGDTSKHDRGTSVWLASAVRATVGSGVTVVGGMLVAFGALATLTAAVLWGLPVLVAMVFAAKLLDGQARRSAFRRARVLPMRLPESTQFADDGVRDIIQRLGQARQAIGHVLDTGPQGRGFDLATSVAQVPQLERDVIVLAHRADYVARFLADNPPALLAVEQRRHRERTEREEDPIRAGLLRRSGARLTDRLDAATALAREYDSLVAAAGDALGALEALPCKLMLLQLRRLRECHMPSALQEAERDDVQASLREIERTMAADPFTPREVQESSDTRGAADNAG